jgi:hypothetical protein
MAVCLSKSEYPGQLVTMAALGRGYIAPFASGGWPGYSKEWLAISAAPALVLRLTKVSVGAQRRGPICRHIDYDNGLAVHVRYSHSSGRRPKARLSVRSIEVGGFMVSDTNLRAASDGRRWRSTTEKVG